MPLQFRESFQLRAPIDRVWDYVADPRQVVTCLPGAELVSVENATTFRGRVQVKVGPITSAYEGTVTILERDDHRRVVRLRGQGRETVGNGSASMTMTSSLVALPGGMTQVEVIADIDLVGRVMQFGRGMIESVNKQLFRQFTACLAATLERPSAMEAGHIDHSAAGPEQSDQPMPPVRPVHLLSVIWHAVLDRLRLRFRGRTAQP